MLDGEYKHHVTHTRILKSQLSLDQPSWCEQAVQFAFAGTASIPDVLDIQSSIKQDRVPAVALIQAEHD